jgi:glycine/D-amino acid oxidase-like deaminating enzyme
LVIMERHANIVIGGGLLGCGIALELAAAGRPVVLIEQDGEVMNRASLRNEGKIHLGLIYAGDGSGRTGRLQLEGALNFRRIVSSWIGADAFVRIGLSTPFTYLVSRSSLLHPEQLQRHYHDLEVSYDAQMRAGDQSLDYLGSRPDFLARPLDVAMLPDCLNREPVLAAFETSERAISTEGLAAEIRHAVLRNPLIELRCGSRVVAMSRQGTGIGVTTCSPLEERPFEYVGDTVFNATWEQRFRLDEMLGIHPAPGWLHRLKYRVIVRLPRGVEHGPSVTIVLGRFGDVVIRPDGTAYLSWYPDGLRGWSHDIAPPATWEAACQGKEQPAVSRSIAEAIMKGIAEWYPCFENCEVLSVDAGAIVARGDRDVDVAESGLHERHAGFERPFGSYFTIDSGKLTTIPLMARRVAAASSH